MTTLPTKPELRRRVQVSRAARSAAARTVAHAQIAANLGPLLTTMARQHRVPTRGATPLTVCAYLPLATEPLPPTLTAELVAAGLRVLVPIVSADGPLDWCDVDAAGLPPLPGGPIEADSKSNAFERGPFGILEPTGPRLGPLAIRTADVVLLPALAVDVAGTRLGRGRGHYDRSLALLDAAGGAPRPRLIAVLFDDEIVDHIPREPHDRPVTDVVTPEFGVCHVVPAASRVAQRGPRGASST